MERVLALENEAETAALAKKLGGVLPQGTVLVLRGPLGAGKTTLVRYLARALGFRGRVTSPTYTLLHVYPTPEGPFVHADLYRLEDPARAEELGLLEEIERARLAAVEWGRPEDFPGAVLVELEPVSEQSRRARLATDDPALSGILARL